MKSFVIGIVAATALVVGAAAQQTPAKPDDKPAGDAKSVAGKWSMSVETQNGAMASTLDLKLDGKKVTGTIASEMGTNNIIGEFADGKLTFNLSIESPNGTFDIAFSGAIKDDGTMAGTASMGDMGSMNWTAQRVKDK